MENFAEEDRRAEADDAYFDIEFALDRRFQPCRNPEKVADRQAENHREEDRFQSQILEQRDGCHGLRRQRDGENRQQRAEDSLDRTSQHGHAEAGQHEQEGEHAAGFEPRIAAGQRLGHGRHSGGKEQCECKDRAAGQYDHPVFGFELS